MNAVKKFGIRAFQFVFYNFAYLMNWRQPEKVEGEGVIVEIPSLLRERGFKKALVVTDKGLMKIGLLNPLLAAFEGSGVEFVLCDNVEPNPKIDNIEEALELYKSNGCDVLVAVGGGSSMDTAKAVGARVARPKRSIEQLGGTLKVLKKIPYLVAVPTTSGTGSEATIAAVVTNRETHHKYAIQDLYLTPHLAVMDPALTVSLPPSITAPTGMDALTHAVEAYICVNVPKYCKKCCEDAVRMIFANVERAYNDGTDLEARREMLHASYYAGRAFTRATLTYVHPIAHTLGGLYNVPHGLANAVVLPYCLEYYGAKIHKKLAYLAKIGGLPVDGLSAADASAAFIAEIRRLNAAMNIPDKFDCIREEDIPQMVAWALKEANPIYQVPVILDGEQIKEIIAEIRA